MLKYFPRDRLSTQVPVFIYLYNNGHNYKLVVLHYQGSARGGIEFGYSIGVDHGNGYSYQTRTGFDSLG